MTGSLAELTVLIVDDNKFIVGLLRRYLEKLGIAAPLEAHDGASALDHVDSAVVDVVLCDLGMPGMDGIEFLRHLADRDAPPDVILLSGQDRSILNTAVRLGRAHGLCVLGSVSKPFTLAPFKALLEQAGNGATGISRGSFQPLTPEAIRAGLAADAVELVFQPKVSLRNRQMIGVETFLRWRDVDGQLKSPAAVVPVAEQWGLINGLTEVVVRKAMTQSGIWRDEGHRFNMAINVSMHDLDRYDFPEFVVDAAESAGADLAAVILEITESQIMADIVKPLEVLSRLRLKGVGLAIDDYGTGASSMQQLKRVPFTELKIDREFVAGAPEDGAARAMLMSSIALGKDLGLTVVAEGVETESEWRLVASRGVDVVQGYFVARPMAAGEMEGWLGRWNSTAC
jgi:EAL domain-containing protein (putative c-di-GMP-specific phosphodiesterase class I)/ActR/RegA family two-component response regulator